jgi:hypothetical protein
MKSVLGKDPMLADPPISLSRLTGSSQLKPLDLPVVSVPKPNPLPAPTSTYTDYGWSLVDTRNPNSNPIWGQSNPFALLGMIPRPGQFISPNLPRQTPTVVNRPMTPFLHDLFGVGSGGLLDQGVWTGQSDQRNGLCGGTRSQGSGAGGTGSGTGNGLSNDGSKGCKDPTGAVYQGRGSPSKEISILSLGLGFLLSVLA